MQNRKFTLPAFAKINLFLKILGKREDNFHDLFTAFQTVSLKDEITFSEADKLVLTCDSPNVPTDNANLIIKAANILKNKFSIKGGAEIYLEKNIPSPGGLGGGSADAATALIGLTRLWNLKISETELQEIAQTLGSDVPFFLYGGTALGTNRGTEIKLLEDFDEKYLLIVTPQIAVSTANAFAGLNAPRLTNSESKSILKICQNDLETLGLRQFYPVNDFEKTVFRKYPEIETAKKMLLECGAKQALMSGSGASVFGIFEKEETRQATIKAISEKYNWRMIAVATIGRDEYARALQMCR